MNIEVKPEDGNLEIEQEKFGRSEESAIISMMFDRPDFFTVILPYIDLDFLEKIEHKLIFAVIKSYYDKHGVIISREICKDILSRELTADDPHQEVMDALDKKLDPREAPVITDRLVSWARKKAYSKLYSEESEEAYRGGDYEQIQKIVEDAQKISDVGNDMFFFFKEIPALFQRDTEERFTTGFPGLDVHLNAGGPVRKEVLCYMAPTGKGKSLLLVNTGAANLRRKKNVLHVTLEMTYLQTALRYMGALSKEKIKYRYADATKNRIEERLQKIATEYGSHLIIKEFPPEDVSIDAIRACIDLLRRAHGIRIDVVIIDYLELLLSRNNNYNKDDYTRQKRVSTEISTLAKKENVLVAAATQTNRSAEADAGVKNVVLDLNKVAESYGKTMPVSYMISINQSKNEYEIGREDPKNKASDLTNSQLRLFIAKNRNGPKFITIYISSNYENCFMEELEKAIIDMDEIKDGKKTSKGKDKDDEPDEVA